MKRRSRARDYCWLKENDGLGFFPSDSVSSGPCQIYWTGWLCEVPCAWSVKFSCLGFAITTVSTILGRKGTKTLDCLLRSSVSFVAIWLQLVEVNSLLPSMQQPRITLKLPIEWRMERLVLVCVYINKTTFFLNRRKSKLPIAANHNEA